MNLPNKLTLFRICLIPVFIFFLTSDVVKFSGVCGLVVFAVASLTDLLDGYIARKKYIITDFGKLMDPLADKMLVMSALVIFVSQGLIKDIFVIVIILRDLMVDSVRLLASSKGKVIAADIWGKLKTFFQMVSIIMLLVYKAFAEILIIDVWADVLKKVKFIGDILMIMAVVLTVISAINYLVKNYEFFRMSE